MKKTISISVRGIVEFILRHGDIDNRRSTSPDDAMQEGARIHKKIQKSMGADYKAEHTLNYEFETEYFFVRIEGRADGIISGETAVRLSEETLGIDRNLQNQRSELTDIFIDEIKGTYRDITKLSEPEPEHLAQAQMYAAVYALQNNLSSIGVQMTYVSFESEEIHYFRFLFSSKEIIHWFKATTEELTKWVDNYGEWLDNRQRSIKTLEFPYPYRPGQKELVVYVYNTIYHGKKLFIEAPTGTGKTLSTLFPAVRSVGENRGDRIFYLTARTIARTVAEEAIAVLKKGGLKYRNLTLTAKDKICFIKSEDSEVECNPKACEYARGHYDRINKCLFDLISTEDSFDRTVIEKYAREYKVCPFELSLDVSLFADLIICDYNYVFDPRAHLRRFFSDGNSGDYLFLIDEAHNLVDRGREMYSATLVKEDLLECKRVSGKFFPRITSAIERCNKDFLELKRDREEIPDNELYVCESIGKLILHTEKLYLLLKEYLADNNDGPEHDNFLDMFFKLSDFLNIYELVEDDYVIYNGFTGTGDFYVKIFNVDPARNLSDCMKWARSSILFSATLLPIQYYKSVLGGTSEDYEVYAQSVFDSSKRLLLRAQDVSSKYSSRSYSQYVKMAQYIYEVTSRQRGNYFVFAPSYSLVNEVADAYEENFLNPEAEEIIRQTQSMDENMREEFLLRFRAEESKDKTLIGFCVLGGIFSEGIDLRSDALIGVLVIGTGLPQIGGERDLLKDYYNSQGLNGFDYAYRYPGMNRVQQAAGRLIRTETDRGVIVLLDDRYAQRDNTKLFPIEWVDMEGVFVDSVGEKVKDFWNKWV